MRLTCDSVGAESLPAERTSWPTLANTSLNFLRHCATAISLGSCGFRTPGTGAPSLGANGAGGGPATAGIGPGATCAMGGGLAVAATGAGGVPAVIDGVRALPIAEVARTRAKSSYAR